MRAVSAAVRRGGSGFAHWWRRRPLWVQRNYLVALPFAAAVVSACLATTGGVRRGRLEDAVRRHFLWMDQLGDVLTLAVDAETGMRGYLLTREDGFLRPYETAVRELPAATAALRATAAAEPGDEVRVRKATFLDGLDRDVARQMSDLAWQRSREAPPDAELARHLALGKRLMDGIRERVESSRKWEEGLLAERIDEIDAIRRRDYAAIVVTLVVAVAARGLAWLMFQAGVTRRAERLAENVRAVRAGGGPPYPPTGKPDALGEVEDEIAALADAREIPLKATTAAARLEDPPADVRRPRSRSRRPTGGARPPTG